MEQPWCRRVHRRAITRRAISDYKRAIKLDKTSATYHSNLATAYFEEKRLQKGPGAVRRLRCRIDPECALTAMGSAA